ncbi:hypothetical protein, partial [Escherichia coli]|uniref:hypothetical protein n=1 Tax=Escherichia coli TaxID=562 RepID=UPI001BDBA96B
SDLLLRRPQGIKPKKKIVKIRDSGLTRKVISALREVRSVRIILQLRSFSAAVHAHGSTASH